MMRMEDEMTRYHEHIPVLMEPAVDLLITDPTGIYVDATLGGAGHSVEILNRLDSGGRLYGIDQDPQALEAAAERVGGDPRFHPLSGNFGYIATLLPPEVHGRVDGILFDLGVSTHQIRKAERGFSFQEEGPLDMRMNDWSRLTAHQIVNLYSYEQLRDLIFHLGEERLSRQIARSIIANRPLETTADLRSAVEQVVSGPKAVKSVARVFQAFRMEVNQELEMLRSALSEGLELLRIGGRMVVISYHSLEDRIVKIFFRSGNHDGKVAKDFYGNEIRPIEPVVRKVIRPDKTEIAANPASRSARLRAAQKIETIGEEE